MLYIVMKLQHLLVLFLVSTEAVISGKEYTSKEDGKIADVKVSVNDNFTIMASNSEKFYAIYFVSNSPKKAFYRIRYDHTDTHVFSLYALKVKSDKTISFLQLVKKSQFQPISFSRIDIDLLALQINNTYKYREKTNTSDKLSDIKQDHILMKIDQKETYAYIFADSFILSYNLLADEFYKYENLSMVHCDSDYGSFIPHAVELKDTLAVMVGVHRVRKSFRQKTCLYIFTLQSFDLIQTRTLDKSYAWTSENTGDRRESIMSLSINPSGTMIAIGQGYLDMVTIAFIKWNATHTNIFEMFQLAEDIKSTDFGRSVTWLDDNGALAILVGKSSNRTGLQSEIQVFTNISSSPTSATILPKFTLPNNQQALHKIPYKSGWRRRSYLAIVARSHNLLIVRDDGKLIHIPSADPGLCSMELVESVEIEAYILICYSEQLCLAPTRASIRKMSSFNESASMVYYFLPKPCITGSYKSTVGFGPCTVCPPGTKNPGYNISSNCLPCKSVEFCSLGASSEVNLTRFNTTTQVFNYPDSPIIDNYDDVLLLNFIPNTWSFGCVLSSPLFIGIIFFILSLGIWFTLLIIKNRQLSSFDTHRKKAKRILKRTDLIGEGERLVGGLASMFVFAIVIYSIVFAVYYLFSYSSDDTWLREKCNDTLRNTKYDNALQLPLPDPQGNDWRIFHLLDEQNFTMTAFLINTGAQCDHIDVYHNKHRIHRQQLIKTYCNDSNNDFTTIFNFDIPTHTSTIQITINQPHFVGALRLCLHGAADYGNDTDGYWELKELDVCTLFYTEKQTIGVSTDFNVDLVSVINVTKPLKRSQRTHYSGIWKPITTCTDELSEGSYYATHGDYLRYASDQTIFTVKFQEENFYVQNNKSPIIRRAAITFHTFMFIFLLIDTIAMIFIIYKLWGQPLVRFLLRLCRKSCKHEYQLNNAEVPTNASSPFITERSSNLTNNQCSQQQYYKTVDRPDIDSNQRLDIHAEKMEYLSNEIVNMKNENEELKRQISYLRQSLSNTA